MKFLDKLDEIVEGATPGPWKIEDGPAGIKWVATEGHDCICRTFCNDETYISRFDPPTMRKILAVVRAVESLKYKNRFDCTVVEANDWEMMQEAIESLRKHVEGEK